MALRTTSATAGWLVKLTMAALWGLSSRGAMAAPTATPAAEFLRTTRVLPEVLVPFGTSSPKEDQQLQAALAVYTTAGHPDVVTPLTAFLAEHPASSWRQSLWLNLGDIYYQQGYFSEALAAWQKAWDSGKTGTTSDQRAIADQAVGELIRMHARIGHAAEVKALLDEVGDRPIAGAATEAVQGAREGLWEMQNEPGVAYLCGPMALRSLLLDAALHSPGVGLLEAVRSGPHGISLAQVARLAEQAGMPYVPRRRTSSDAIPVPSVVHWNLQHYAAIVSEDHGRYLVKDPTFGRDLWLTAAAINAETSGFFMVRADQPTVGWRAITTAEGENIRGMGYTGNIVTNADRPYDDKSCCSAGGSSATSEHGMPRYAVHSAMISLNLEDTPVGYTPPKGPAVEFTVTYNQREASQPAVFPFSNLGQKWTHNWLSYVVDDPTLAGASVSLAVAGGGSESYAGYSSSTGQFTPESRLGAVLVRTSGAPIAYERRFSDGSIHVFQQSDGASAYPRRIFLTAVKDPAGNAVTLTYDAQLRLIRLTDALGQITNLTYGDIANPLRITKVTDPFGRFATFAYDASGRISQITDTIGLASSVAYDAATFITGLTTPYGTTTFSYSGTDTTRWLMVTDPLGYSERVEALNYAPGIAFSEAAVPTGVNVFNQYLDARNTFYWDKDAYATAPGDYTKAQLKHWAHWSANTSYTSAVLESSREPNESRIWYNYPGQTSGGFTGTQERPTVTARLLDDGSTQRLTAAYNSFNLVTQSIDPVGRELDYVYAANGIDLLQIKRKNGASFDLLATYTYNAQHLPLTYVDDAGKTTTTTYTAAGQVATVTNALLQVTSYEYDANGYLLRIRNANGIVQQSYTYDSVSRIRTATDSEGYTLTYDYDALDRVTKITYPDATFESATYNKLDVSQSRDRLGHLTNYTYNANRQLTQTGDALPRTVRMEWSRSGRQTALFDGENRPIHWEYDIQGRRTAEVYADNTRKSFAYDLASRVKAITDAMNQVKQVSYAADNRVSGLSYTNAVHATPAVSFAYDAVYPRLISMADGVGTTTYAYGAVGALGAQRLLREDGPYASNDVLAYTYDALGRRATRTIGATYSAGVLSGGQAETLTYDVLGRIGTKTNPIGGFTFSYLGQTGQVSKRLLAASGTLLSPVMQVSYADNLHDRHLARLRYATSDTTADAARLQDYNYTYDALDRLTRADESVYGANGALTTPQFWDVVHDNADRLLTYAPATGSATGTTWYEYTYDRADSRGVTAVNGTITQTPTINVLNQIATFNGTTYTYDADGNLLNDGARTFTWDAENRLTKVVKTGPGAGTFTYSFDGIGRRIGSVVGTTTYRHLWCDEKVCETRNVGTGALIGTWFDDGVVVNGASYVYFRDQLGSIRQVRSRTPTQVWVLDYGPYGGVGGTSQVVTTYRFADLFVDSNAGLYLTWHRAYDPKTGRWLNRDPIGIGGGTNLYSYVGGAPLSATDPLGLFDMTPSLPPTATPVAAPEIGVAARAAAGRVGAVGFAFWAGWEVGTKINDIWGEDIGNFVDTMCANDDDHDDGCDALLLELQRQYLGIRSLERQGHDTSMLKALYSKQAAKACHICPRICMDIPRFRR